MTLVAFVILVFFIILCILIFGKADSKRNLLQSVGLDLSESAYEGKKESEFANYCKKAMKVAINNYDVKGEDEKDFLEELEDVLFKSMFSESNCFDDEGIRRVPRYNLQVDNYYANFARDVVRRRLNELRHSNPPLFYPGCNFLSKTDLKKYIEILWKKYQHPWPNDWIKYGSHY